VRQGDDEDDLTRLRSLHALLTRQPGPDRFELVVVDSRFEHRLLLPEPTTTYSAEVERALVELLGPNNVRIL